VAYYYTHEKSYYPIVSQATGLNALPLMIEIEWAASNVKAVRQHIVHQETTKFKAETLPLNMYATSA